MTTELYLKNIVLSELCHSDNGYIRELDCSDAED